jgi:predicted aminopeptidase
MPVQFDGFSDREKIYMMEAYKVLRRGSAAARQSLLGGDLAAYKKWFDGTGSTAHLMKVATIVNEVDSAIVNRPITFAKLDRPGLNVNTRNLCAYVWLVQSGGQVFHVGSGMRILVVWSTHANASLGYLAQTMYHELTHKVGNTTDVNYNEQTCLNFAKSAPQTAVQNAENYNLFLREFL